MAKPAKLLCVLAHPDDESMGMGGMLAHYAAQGIETYLVMGTRGERGWHGAAQDYPGPAALGRVREAELLAAADVLGLAEVVFLDYIDGELDQAPQAQAIARIVRHIRRIRPDVLVTFGPDGLYGHPDHIAISQLATAALVSAADRAFEPHAPAHRVAKLYYKVWSEPEAARLAPLFGGLAFPVDGQRRGPVAWRDWAITTQLDTVAYWQTVWRAISCHQSQLIGDFRPLLSLSDTQHQLTWGPQSFYRVYSLVNGGRGREHDLFAGLR